MNMLNLVQTSNNRYKFLKNQSHLTTDCLEIETVTLIKTSAVMLITP